MKKFFLFVLMVFLTFSAGQVHAVVLTEREAGKIAYADWQNRNGQVMIPEYGLRVDRVELVDEVHYRVRLSIYDVIDRQKLYDVAEYLINGDTGEIVKYSSVRESITVSLQMINSLSRKAKNAQDHGNEAELRAALDHMDRVVRGTALAIGLELRAGDCSKLVELATVMENTATPEIYSSLVKQVVLVAKSRMLAAQLSEEAKNALEILSRFC